MPSTGAVGGPGSPRADLTATLVARDQLSPDAQVLRFESEAPFRVLPGQFTMVRVGGGGLLRRPYSYCDLPGDGAFTLLVKEVGVGTRALMSLPVGGEVSSLGPLGTTFDPPPPDLTPVIVAGGVGIAPFVLFCRRLAENGRRGIVLLGGRRRPDLYLWDAFERFGMDVRVASEDGSVGHRGFVTALLDAALADAGRPFLYSCGPTGMLLRVAELATAAGVPHQVSIERRMGCGMGCCLGCVVWARPPSGGPEEYLRSCTEGPVFDAGTIDWDRDPHPL
ncbi:MAG: FAD-binding oxidoreductase [Acidobacteriota bacterium]|nr:FAD-binding oxidoreductase [Acidobacteriota bacterium]